MTPSRQQLRDAAKILDAIGGDMTPVAHALRRVARGDWTLTDRGRPTGFVRPGDLILAADVRRLAGDVTRKTLTRWRQQHDDFPQPIRAFGSGPGIVEIWDRRDVTRWLKAHPASDAPEKPQRATGKGRSEK